MSGFNQPGGGATTAAGVSVNTAGGLVGPSVQTALQALHDAIGGTQKATGFLLVASNDAPASVKAGADYVCDGVNDQVEINAALVLAAPLQTYNPLSPAGAAQRGVVMLTGGRFNIGGSILMQTGTTLQGQGRGTTEIRCVNITAATGAGANLGAIKLAVANGHMTTVKDFWLNGTFAAGMGGTAVHGIHYDMSGGTDTTDYPNTDPDSYHYINNLLINGFTTSTRHGIWLYASATANLRAAVIDAIDMRVSSGDGIRLETCSDSFVANCHVGGSGGSGYYINGGNTRMANNKSFFSNTHGLWLVSGRCTVVGYETQDDFQGIIIDGSPSVLTGLTIDTSSASGLQVSSSKAVVGSFSIFNRGGGRYATTTLGLYFDATYTDLQIGPGNIEPASVTTPVSGAVGARSFAHWSDGTTQTATG